MGASVRVATRSDLHTLIELRARWTAERRDERADGTFASRFAQWFDDEAPQRTFWLAEVDATAVGMVNLAVFTRMPAPADDAGGWGYLGNMYVEPDYRNRGIGSLLLAALVAHADAQGLARVVLHPTERSVPFYRRAGFDAATQLLLRPGA